MNEIGLKPYPQTPTGRPPKKEKQVPEGSKPWCYDPFKRDDIFREFLTRYEDLIPEGKSVKR